MYTMVASQKDGFSVQFEDWRPVPECVADHSVAGDGRGGGSYSANEKRTGVVEGEDKSVLVVGLESDLDFAALLLEEPRWVSDRLVQASSS